MASRRPQRQGSTDAAQFRGYHIILLVAVCALVLIGLVMVYSASSANLVSEGESPYSDVVGQVIFLGIGIVLMIVVWRLSYRVWVGKVIWVVWAIGIALLFLTALFGTESYGAKRWLTIGSFSLQSSEFVKIALLLMTVRIVYNAYKGVIELRAAIVQGIVCVVCPLLFLYIAQSDLGTTCICFVAILAVMWFGGVSKRAVGIIAAIGVVFVVIAIVGTGYRSGRMVYLDPWNDGEGGYGAGYQFIRSYYAFAEGGLFGVGLGNSHEKYQYLFGSESDYIFAIIGEEFGMVGALAVIALFAVLLWVGMRIAMQSQDGIGTMIAAGATIMLVFQAFLNIGCAIGVFPTTGKPLPFISAGGSSIIASMILVGLILSVSRVADQPSIYEQRRANLRIVRAQNARTTRLSESYGSSALRR